MGFSKSKNTDTIGIIAEHPYHPDTKFVFYLTKRASREAADAQSRFIGLPEDERPEVYREGLVETVAHLLAKEPEGFDDFPTGDQPLHERATAYFDDAEQVEFEAILATVWRRYIAAAVPAVYLKSPQGDVEGGDGVRNGAVAA